jgi:hypothetical protein
MRIRHRAREQSLSHTTLQQRESGSPHEAGGTGAGAATPTFLVTSRLSSARFSAVEGGGIEAKCSSLRPRCTSCISEDNGCGLVVDVEGLVDLLADGLEGDFDLSRENWWQVRMLPIALVFNEDLMRGEAASLLRMWDVRRCMTAVTKTSRD